MMVNLLLSSKLLSQVETSSQIDSPREYADHVTYNFFSPEAYGCFYKKVCTLAPTSGIY